MAGSMDRNGVRLGVSLSLLTAGQLLTSFGIQWYTIAGLGAGSQTDALYAGSSLLQLCSAVVLDQLSFVLVPLLAAREERERAELGWPLFIGIGTLFTLVTLLLYATAPYLVPLMTPGFNEPTALLAVELARIQLLGLLGAACFTVLSALHQARNQFLWPSGAVLISTLVGWWILMAGLASLGVRLAAWVQVVLWCGPALLLVRALGPWSPAHTNHSAVFRDLWLRVRPLLLSAALVRTGFVVDRFLTSFLAAGSLVLLDVTWRVMAAIVRIFNQGLVTPAVPTLATLAKSGRWQEFVRLCQARLLWMGGAGLMASALLFAAVTLGRSFGDNLSSFGVTVETLGTIQTIVLAGGGLMLFGGLTHVLVNAFYAEGETGIPARVEIGTSLAGLALKGVGFLMGGLIGIAVATSIQYAFSTLLLGVLFHRRMATRLRSNAPNSVQSILVIETPGQLS
ncbi:MAG: hypothetical protein ABS70_05995 [Nitrospira sp. SCN 59-13]|nr:MAG: hypothetical protein ABS70_05995 [Nitrospira sp. SCN 59-13]